MSETSNNSRRLGDLLVEPRETLEVELKGWLELEANADHKAVLAKAIIALANHGGGWILIGFSLIDGVHLPASGRPISLAGFTTDTINSIIHRYCQPSFHCDVAIELGPDGLSYPIVVVPGGHHVPIRSLRDSPDGSTVRRNSYYIRRPGPQSEVPQTGQEWDALIRRVITNARDDLVDQFRTILAGGPAREPGRTRLEQTADWFNSSFARWQEIVSARPPADPARMPHGYFAVGYTIEGDIGEPSLGELRDIIRRAKVPHTGWPEFWVPTKQSISPYIHQGSIECWIGGDNDPGLIGRQDSAHSDFWRASPRGRAFLIRGHQEDGADFGGTPGASFDITTPTWRFGEALLHASRLATELGDPNAEVSLVAEWSGLAGRALSAHYSTGRHLLGEYRSRQEMIRVSVTAPAFSIESALPELVEPAMRNLYEIFDFFQLPANLVTEELAKMRSNRF